MNWKQPKVYAVNIKMNRQERLPDRVVFLQPCLVKYCPTAV